jgi:hypothetical protein
MGSERQLTTAYGTYIVEDTVQTYSRTCTCWEGFTLQGLSLICSMVFAVWLSGL